MSEAACAALRLLAGIGVTCVLASCDDMVGGTAFLAKSAHIGKWEDKRPSGSIIMHDMLVIDQPRAVDSQGAPLGAYVITTTGAMAAKIEDVISDRLPAAPGARLNFAVGNPVEVRIQKVLEGGKREAVGEARAAFLEITR